MGMGMSMGRSVSLTISVRRGTIALSVVKVMVLMGLVDGLGWLRRYRLLGLHLHLLLLGECDDTACNRFALAFAEAALTIVSLRVLVLVKVIVSLVQNNCFSKHGVGSAEADEEISVIVLGVSVEAGLDTLKVTDAPVIDVKVGVSMLGTEGVKDVANVLAVAVLVNLSCMEARLDVCELAQELCEIVSSLLKLNLASRPRVSLAQEIKLAGGIDLFLLFGVVQPMLVDGLNIVSLDITGADSAAAHPWEVIRVTIAVSIALVPIVAVVASGLLGTIACTWSSIGLSVVDVLLSCGDTQYEGAGKCDLGKHYY